MAVNRIRCSFIAKRDMGSRAPKQDPERFGPHVLRKVHVYRADDILSATSILTAQNKLIPTRRESPCCGLFSRLRLAVWTYEPYRIGPVLSLIRVARVPAVTTGLWGLPRLPPGF